MLEGENQGEQKRRKKRRQWEQDKGRRRDLRQETGPQLRPKTHSTQKPWQRARYYKTFNKKPADISGKEIHILGKRVTLSGPKLGLLRKKKKGKGPNCDQPEPARVSRGGEGCFGRDKKSSVPGGGGG